MATPPTTSRRGRPALPPPTLVLFVRHGLTPTTGKVLPGRAPGLHLSDQGRALAEAVAERLASWSAPGPTAAPAAAGAPAEPGAATAASRPAPGVRAARRPPTPRIAAVYTSPMERTRETAAPIARRLGLKAVVERGLIECDFGEWTGAELKDLAKLPEWVTVQRFPSGFRFPGGESFLGMQARMVDTVMALCRRHPGQAVVAVSHADPIKAAVSDAIGTQLDLFQRIMVSPCSVSAVQYHSTGPAVLAVNSTGSLTEVLPA
jgi:probable phosphomutase (TIGR03848 family)